LCCILDRSRLAKELAGDSEYSWAIAAHYLLKRALVSLARQAYQLEIRSLFDINSQGTPDKTSKTAGPRAHPDLPPAKELTWSSVC
jgi:hypothetical protein